jgi:hypothetical protein
VSDGKVKALQAGKSKAIEISGFEAVKTKSKKRT